MNHRKAIHVKSEKTAQRASSDFRARARMVAALVAAGLQAAATPGAAESLNTLAELSLEQLATLKVETVYGASKHAQKTTEAPSSVSVVSSDEIKRYGYRTLADLLQSLQGFHVSQDRNYAFLGTRGVNLGDFNSRMLLLVDGHRVNNNLTDSAYIDTAFILDMDLIDRVEVIRGPGSVLYGNNAFFGVVNVITRTGKQINGVEATGEYGSFDTYKGRVTIGKSFTNGVDLLLSGTFYESQGEARLFYPEFNTPAQNMGVARDMDADSFGSFFGSLRFLDFTLQGGFIQREKVNPTAQYFTTFNDPRLQTVDDHGYAELKFTHDFPEIATVMARVYYDQNNFSIGYPFGVPVASAFFEETQRGEWWGAELQLTKTIYDRHILTFGAEYRDDFHQAKSVFDQTATFTDVHVDSQSHGVFAQGDFELHPKVHINGGVRYDQYGDFDPAFSPRFALIYNPVERSTIKALYGTAFRSPNFLELSDPRFQNIRPEEITSYELVYEQAIGQHMRSSVAAFYNQMDDLIVFQSGRFANANAESKGAELALEGKWMGGVHGRASYTFQKTENTFDNSNFADSPEHLFKFNLSVPLVKDTVFASIEYQYTSRRHTVFTSSAGQTLPGSDADAYGVVNLTLFSQNLVENMDLSASVYNLLDESYADPSTRFHLQDQIAGTGRNFRVKLTYRF